MFFHMIVSSLKYISRYLLHILLFSQPELPLLRKSLNQPLLKSLQLLKGNRQPCGKFCTVGTYVITWGRYRG
jgi:hypothetical protein